jgi:ligand-binding SRPBCC domain-containing protein
MKFVHRFRVKAPLQKVAEFHHRSSSMAAITPPPIRVQLHHAPAQVKDGDLMRFTLSLGPIPVRWLARFESVSGNGFIDRQIEGPFQDWIHKHEFTAIEDNLTEITDKVSAKFKANLLWRTVGVLMWLGLPSLFAYRSWKTKRLLER